MKTTIVTTTIHVPYFLKAYADDALRYGHDVNFIVIGDNKTPKEARTFCETIPNCAYQGIFEQAVYMQKFPELARHIPYDSFERRDIGLLMAYEQGADVIITIDDDNLLATQDVLGWHDIVVRGKVELPIYSSTSGWFNVCSMLKEENDIEFYHRGYSPRHRWEKNAYIDSQIVYGNVVVNAGLWFNNPDTDAITRLERKLNVTGFKIPDSDDCGSLGLAPGTWSPFNCQNTALAREVIPAYFMSPYTGRHSDIFASYVINRIAEHFGDVVAFGLPLSNHERSHHNLWHDVELERDGMQRTDEFCDALRSIQLTGKSYHECFGEISRQLKGFDKITEGMLIWHDVFERITR